MTEMSTPSLPTRALRVVVVDDQLPFRIALRRVLQRATDVDVVAEGADGAEAIDLVDTLHPDVVVLDVRMPGTDGPTAARVIADRWPEVTVVLCSSHARDDLPADLAAPYVPKELLSADVLQRAVREHASPH
ncbi:MAG TPA: response regulator transcription factor [Jatrophihabitans sp.]|jgi:DNA-binding NarL/FixJ family response regulator